jgi:pilus assembly protein CpaB
LAVSRFSVNGLHRRLAALVTPESRAVVVKVDRELAAARLLYPGARVDVLVTLRDPFGGAGSLTRTVLENVKVLAVGSFADAIAARRGQTPTDKSMFTGGSVNPQDVVTLEVSPSDAERVSLAAREGKIDVTLRNATDANEVNTEGVTLSDLSRGTSAGASMEALMAGPGSKKAPRAPRATKKGRAQQAQAPRPAPDATPIRVIHE